MTISRILTVAIAALTVFATQNLNAQQSYSKSWSNQSSWSQSESWGPNGYQTNGTSQSSQRSSETLRNGGRTQTIRQNHNQAAGYSQGYDQNGQLTNSSQYNHRNGQTQLTDRNVQYDRYGNRIASTNQMTNRYNSPQGISRSRGANGWNTTGYNNQGQSQTRTQQLQVRDIWGNTGSMGQTQTLGYQNNRNFSRIMGSNGPVTSRNQTLKQFDFGKIWQR